MHSGDYEFILGKPRGLKHPYLRLTDVGSGVSSDTARSAQSTFGTGGHGGGVVHALTKGGKRNAAPPIHRAVQRDAGASGLLGRVGGGMGRNIPIVQTFERRFLAALGGGTILMTQPSIVPSDVIAPTDPAAVEVVLADIIRQTARYFNNQIDVRERTLDINPQTNPDEFSRTTVLIAPVAFGIPGNAPTPTNDTLMEAASFDSGFSAIVYYKVEPSKRRPHVILDGPGARVHGAVLPLATRARTSISPAWCTG